jgi:hypothetical protein
VGASNIKALAPDREREKAKSSEDCVGRDTERKEENFGMIVITWTSWQLIRKPLRSSWSYGGSGGSSSRVITTGKKTELSHRKVTLQA